MTYSVQVTLVNEDTDMIFNEYVEDIHEYDLNDDGTPNFGDIYRSAQREYGRCQSSIYVDRAEGPPKRVGWYFVKRDEYDGHSRTGERTYLRGAWVSVIERKPETRSLVSLDSVAVAS